MISYHSVIRRADAFCFDVDSTICKNEAIDDLAKWCNIKDISNITKKTMNGGNVCFRESLKTRLDLIRPTKNQLNHFIEHNPPQFSHGIYDLIDVLYDHNKDVFLVSGSFRPIIEPVALSLSVPIQNIYGNTLLFDEKTGEYIGFDVKEYTSTSEGKSLVIQDIKQRYNYHNVVMIGDGITDLNANADFFIGYGGVCERNIIKEKADLFIYNFDEITSIFTDVN